MLPVRTVWHLEGTKLKEATVRDTRLIHGLADGTSLGSKPLQKGKEI